MKPNETNETFAVVGDVNSPTYLGSPVVVGDMVREFATMVYELMKKRGTLQITGPEFVGKLRERIGQLGSIFNGESIEFVPVVGWNCRIGVGVAAQQSLGAFWEAYAAEYGDDPVQALFGWLAASVVDAAKAAQGDADLAGIEINGKIEQVIRILLGTHARRG